jgi:outer membrane protein OmpA-like peptidoglycan-associated protein
MVLATCLGLLCGRAGAQEGGSPAEFDDDFGAAPAAAPEEALPAQASDDEPAKVEQNSEAPAAQEEPIFAHNTIDGLTGGVHVVGAGSGPARSFRLAVAFDFMRADGYLAPSALHRHGGMALSLSVTPVEHLELAAQLSVTGDADESGRPSVIQVVGDARLFAKGYTTLKPWLTVGGDMQVALLNAIGALGYQADATSVGLRGNASFDLRKLRRRLPVIVRTSMRYYFDNSAKLISTVESARYDALPNPAPPGSEYRHLLTNVERLAYHINRTDQFGLDFGFEFPFAPRKDVLISPLLEWTVSVPVNRQGYDCLLTNAANDRDGCLASEGFAARPSTMTFGLRAQPKLPGLGLLFALDVGTTGAHTFVRELAPTLPYDIYLGFSYAYDMFAKHEPPAPRFERVEVPVEKVRGHIVGEVIEQQTQQPVAHALVHFNDSALSDLATDQNGKFVSYPFDPGAQHMALSADGYEPGACSAVLPADLGDVAVRCQLVALPKLGSVRGRVLDGHGRPVTGARVSLTGPQPLNLQSDASGSFSSDALAAGEYEARVEANGYLVQAASIVVREKSESALLFTLMEKPAQSLVALTPKRIAIKQQVQFVAGSAEIAPASNALLSEVADLLLRNPAIARVEIQGHTDNSGTESMNAELSEKRAQAVRDWLLKAGVQPERLSAAGYGSSRPLAPNITQQNRARNRRVELVILEMRQ